MNSSNIRFSLDIQSTQSQVSIPVSLNDTARVFHISLTDGSAPYTIADGCLAVASIKRPSGTHIETFCAVENNTTIKYDFADNPDTAIAEGLHDCQVTLFDADEKQVASARFSMVVHDRVVNSSDINIPDGDRTAIDAMIAREASRQAAEEARVNAEAGRVNAEAGRVSAEEERQAYYEDFMNRVNSGEFGGGTSGGGDTSELKQTVARHTEQIEQIDRRVSTLESGGGSGGGGSGGGGDTTELKQRIANAEADIEDLDQRVEVNEENIRDLYNKLPSGGNANFIFADSVEKLPDPSTVPEDTVALVPSKGGSGGTTIHYYNSLGEVPADLPDGSFVAVPSSGESGGGSGGGGLQVIEISAEYTTEEMIPLPQSESDALANASNIGLAIIVKITSLGMSTIASYADNKFTITIGGNMAIMFAYDDELGCWVTWVQTA